MPAANAEQARTIRAIEVPTEAPEDSQTVVEEPEGAEEPRSAARGAQAAVVASGMRRVIVGPKTMRLLKAMREQLGETSASRTVAAVAAADAIGIATATRDFDGRLHDLVRAGYLEEDPNFAAPTVRGMYRITFAGMDAADNY